LKINTLFFSEAVLENIREGASPRLPLQGTSWQAQLE